MPPESFSGIFICRHQTKARQSKWNGFFGVALAVTLFFLFVIAVNWGEMPWWGRGLALVITLIPAALARQFRKEAATPLGLHLHGFRVTDGRLEVGTLVADFKDQAEVVAGTPRDLLPIQWIEDKKQPGGPTHLKLHLTSWDRIAQEDVGSWRVDHLSIRSQQPAVFHYFEFVDGDPPFAVLNRGKLQQSFPEKTRGQRLLQQLRAAAGMLRQAGLPGQTTIEFQVKAPSGNKAAAAAFGAIGLAISALSDERKAAGAKQGLGAKVFLGPGFDEEFFALADELHVQLSVG